MPVDAHRDRGAGLTLGEADVHRRGPVFRDDPTRYVSLTMEFRCNLRCTHCMIEGTMDRLHPASEAEFQAVLERQRATAEWDGLILTGSEITLLRRLPELAQQARAAGFRHVRIQTHGMHLARRDYLLRLLEAGVDEFFISVAGDTAATHDRVTTVPGSFDKLIAGMENLETSGYPIRILTNTVVTQETVGTLRGIVARFAGFPSIVQHEFWNYFPMRERDDKNLIVPYAELMPVILGTIEDCAALGRGVEVKNVPKCLLGQWQAALVNTQPMLIIDPEFWTEFDRNGFHSCVYRDQCAATDCLGLTEAYIARFGDERDILSPIAANSGVSA